MCVKERFLVSLLLSKEKSTDTRDLKAFSKQTSKGKWCGRTDRSWLAFTHCSVCVTPGIGAHLSVLCPY